jgi:hypothetical protein
MTFELLKVCRQANPAWIELRVMYVRSTVTDRHARETPWAGLLLRDCGCYTLHSDEHAY